MDKGKLKMNIKSIFKMDKRIMLYVLSIFIGNLIFWIMAAKTDWKSTQTVFLRWDHWTYMDWFSEFMRFNDGAIYVGEEPANYPAFCFIIYRIFYSFVPIGDERLTSIYSIRNMQQTLIPMAFLEIMLLFVLYHVLKSSIKTTQVLYKEIFVIAILMSAPYMHLYERANLIYFSLIGTYVYILKYDSEKKEERFLAYIALAIAAAIKVYPAIFGILTLQKKRYAETILLVVLGCVTFFLPFMLYGGGASLAVYLDTVFKSFENFGELGFGYDFSIYNLERVIMSMIHGYQEHATNISKIVVLLLLIVALITCRELWKELVILTLFIIFIPSFSYEYILCFFALPFIYMINQTSKKIHYIYTLEFVLIGFPWIHIPIESVNYLNGEQLSHTFSLGHLIMYIGLISLLITILADNIYCLSLTFRKKRGTNREDKNYEKSGMQVIDL